MSMLYRLATRNEHDDYYYRVDRNVPVWAEDKRL
jgi:hypothetical protein